MKKVVKKHRRVSRRPRTIKPDRGFAIAPVLIVGVSLIIAATLTAVGINKDNPGTTPVLPSIAYPSINLSQFPDWPTGSGSSSNNSAISCQNGKCFTCQETTGTCNIQCTNGECSCNGGECKETEAPNTNIPDDSSMESDSWY